MKRGKITLIAFVASLFLLSVVAIVRAESAQTANEPPAISQNLVREGEFAVKLLFTLGLGTTDDEVEAESRLAAAGIAPRNGWIADYPVTPDILGELQKSVSDAVDSGKLSLRRDEALNRLNDVSIGFGLAVKPHVVTKTYETLPEEVEDYPDPSVINNYYYEVGPPVVTYYAPPPAFYYLYSWVPYPFWCSSLWFPGFFILSDFHKPVYYRDRVYFVSNHYNDFRRNRVYRIDPVSRFRGRTFAGIGVHNRRDFISTGVPGSARTIFNGSRERLSPGMRIDRPSYSRSRTFTPRSPGVVGVSPRPASRGSAVTTPTVRNRSHGALGAPPRVAPGRSAVMAPTPSGAIRSSGTPSGRTYGGSGIHGGFSRGMQQRR